MDVSNGRADAVIALADRHSGHEVLVFLAGLSVAWLEPQNPEALQLLRVYREREYPVEALREAALQLFLLAGFQTSLEAAFQIHEVFGETKALNNESDRTIPQDLLERGYALQARVYAEHVEKLRLNLARVSPELERWTAIIGYGLVLSRPGIPPHWRELLEVVVLASQGFPRQLHSHLRGALNLGASTQEVELILEVSGLFSAPDENQRSWQLWRQVGR